MANRLKIEGVDASECFELHLAYERTVKGILRVENTTETSESNNCRTATNINEEPNAASELIIQSEVSKQTELTNPAKTPIQKCTGEKIKKEALEQYRQTFLQVSKIDDCKPLFVSCHTWDRFDEIVRRLGGRKMSVSGLIENLTLHHLELYGEDIGR